MRRATLTDRLLARRARAHTDRRYARFVRDTGDATDGQERLLRSMLRDNAGSGHAKQNGFASMRGYDDDARQIPSKTDADLAPWIERVRAGDTCAMFGGPQAPSPLPFTNPSPRSPRPPC